MKLPPELTSLVRAAAKTVEAWRGLKEAHRDESVKARARHEKALWASLEKLDTSLSEVMKLAKRPNEPIDAEALFANIMKGIELAGRVVGRARSIGSTAGSRVGRIIDVKPEE